MTDPIKLGLEWCRALMGIHEAPRKPPEEPQQEKEGDATPEGEKPL